MIPTTYVCTYACTYERRNIPTPPALCLGTLVPRQKKRKQKELIKHIECSNVLVACEYLAAVSENVHGAAEASEGNWGGTGHVHRMKTVVLPCSQPWHAVCVVCV